MKSKVLGGTVHPIVDDLKKMLEKDKKTLAAWNDITPLARNEFICWVISPKKLETRAKRIQVTLDKLSKGERRPCCWIGCIHRTDKEISPSIRAILNKKTKK